MSKISLEQLLNKPDASLYKLVLAAAARANELAQGAPPLIHPETKKVSTIALQEIAAGKVFYKVLESKEK